MHVCNFPGELVHLSLLRQANRAAAFKQAQAKQKREREKGRTKDKDCISWPDRHGSSAFVQKLLCSAPKLTLTALQEAKLLQKIVMPPLQQRMSTRLLYWNVLVPVKGTHIM